MFCPKCGKNLPDNAMFCDGCGTNLSQATSMPASYAKKSSVGMGFKIVFAVIGLLTLIGAFLPFYSASDNLGMGLSNSATLFDMDDGLASFIAFALMFFGAFYILTGFVTAKGLYITSLVFSVFGFLCNLLMLFAKFAAEDRYSNFGGVASVSMGIGFWFCMLGTIAIFVLSIIGISKKK